MNSLRWFKLDRKHGLLYVKLLCLSLLYILPVILADWYYQDDLARAVYGATGWKGDGRPLGEALVVWLAGGGRLPILDIAPLPLLLAVGVMSYTLVLYAQNNWQAVRAEWPEILVLLFILTNPFAMENLSYRFDSLMMFGALSIPFLLYAVSDRLPRPVGVVFSFACTVVVMSMYQPAVCTCFVLSILYVYQFLLGEKERIDLEVYRLAGIAAGGVFYKLVIANRYVDWKGWQGGASDVISVENAVSHVVHNIMDTCGYLATCMEGMHPLFLLAGAAVAAFACLAAVLCFCREKRAGRLYKTVKIVFALFSLPAAFIAAFLPLMLLENLPLKSRAFLSLGGVLFCAGMIALYVCRNRRLLLAGAGILCAVCLLGQYAYMYAYADALKAQDEYQKYLVYNIAHDIEIINCDGDFSEIAVIGDAPLSRQTALAYSKYPFLKSIIPVYINNSTWRGGVWLYMYMQEGLSLAEPDDSDYKITESGNAVLRNSIYSCYTNGDKIIIYFHSRGSEVN